MSALSAKPWKQGQATLSAVRPDFFSVGSFFLRHGVHRHGDPLAREWHVADILAGGSHQKAGSVPRRRRSAGLSRRGPESNTPQTTRVARPEGPPQVLIRTGLHQ